MTATKSGRVNAVSVRHHQAKPATQLLLRSSGQATPRRFPPKFLLKTIHEITRNVTKYVLGIRDGSCDFVDRLLFDLRGSSSMKLQI